jgi:hypothetical protein
MKSKNRHPITTPRGAEATCLLKQLFAIVAALLAVLLSAPGVVAQTYEVTWHTVDGGGTVTAAGGGYEASGTIGQPDAADPTGGDYLVTGGFWSFGSACNMASAAAADVLDLPATPVSRKIRHLSFSAGDAGREQAIRVTFQNLPVPYTHWNGVQLWIQQPQAYCENSGTVQGEPCPPQVGGLPRTWFWGAELGCDAHVTNWTQYDVVHVWDEGIIPAGEYDIQVIDASCSFEVEGNYSLPLSLVQSDWADLVQDCTTIPCGPPNGDTGIVDVTAILDKYKNLPGNVQKVRADIEGSPAGDHRIPDQAINITDVTYCLGAFLGETYPAPGFPPPSPAPVCP